MLFFPLFSQYLLSFFSGGVKVCKMRDAGLIIYSYIIYYVQV